MRQALNGRGNQPPKKRTPGEIESEMRKINEWIASLQLRLASLEREHSARISEFTESAGIVNRG